MALNRCKWLLATHFLLYVIITSTLRKIRAAFWGVVAGEHCRELTACQFYVFLRKCAAFWGVVAGEHCRELTACQFYVFLRECAFFLGCSSWRTLQGIDCLPVLCFFVRMRGLFGVF